MYFCVRYRPQRAYQKQHRPPSTARIYSETHRQLKGCCTTERLIKQASNYIHLWRYTPLLYVHKGTNKYP